VQIRPREGEHLLPTDPILRDIVADNTLEQIRPHGGEHLLPADPVLRDKQFPEFFVFKHVHPMVGSSGISFLGVNLNLLGLVSLGHSQIWGLLMCL
jgi:acyl-homoserine lactone acylase PvdQ